MITTLSKSNRGAWLRAYGDRFTLTTANSTSGAAIAGRAGGVQFGYDLQAAAGDTGQWTFGITGQYGAVTSTITNATGHGLGATATWLGNSGLYFDTQAQANWLTADYAATGTTLATNQNALGYGLSAEIDQRFALVNTAALIPQAQLTWSKLKTDTFNDSAGNAINLGSQKRLIGRLGLTYENAYPTTDGGAEKYYVIGNLFHDMSRANSVTVAATPLIASDAKTWAEIGLGGSKSWDKKSHVFGEVTYRKSLNATRSASLGLTAGFSVKW